MVATSGSVLADEATIEVFEWLMDLATLTTPNVPELEALGGAAGMADRKIAYLAKGGDADGPMVEDRLVRPGAQDAVVVVGSEQAKPTGISFQDSLRNAERGARAHSRLRVEGDAAGAARSGT